MRVTAQGLARARGHVPWPTPLLLSDRLRPAWFLLLSFTICVMAALLFARTRGSWAAGWKGGLSFGFFLGLVIFFQRFYDPLVIEGFPYYLAWCQGGISMIDSLLAGAVIGSIVKA